MKLGHTDDIESWKQLNTSFETQGQISRSTARKKYETDGKRFFEEQSEKKIKEKSKQAGKDSAKKSLEEKKNLYCSSA